MANWQLNAGKAKVKTQGRKHEETWRKDNLHDGCMEEKINSIM